MALTQEQKDIVDYCVSRQGNAVIAALPGSGKSYTLGEIAKALNEPHQTLVITFMKKTAEDTKVRMPANVVVINAHSLGYRIIYHQLGKKHLTVDKFGYKYRDLTYQAVQEHLPALHASQFDETLSEEARQKNKNIITEMAFSINALSKMVRGRYVDYKDAGAVEAVALDYNLNPNADMLMLFPYVMEMGIKSMLKFQTAWIDGKEKKLWHYVDFMDQIYMPVLMGWQPETKYKYVMCDEIQDMGLAMVKLAMSFVAEGGFIYGAGDENQTIMSFSGVDINAFRIAKAELNAKEFGLTLTYRFGVNIAAQVEEIAHIETAGNGCVPGKVLDLTPQDFLSGVQPGDIVLARWNKHLFSAALNLLRDGRVPVRLVGDERMQEDILAMFRRVEERLDFNAHASNILSTFDLYHLADIDPFDDPENDDDIESHFVTRTGFSNVPTILHDIYQEELATLTDAGAGEFRKGIVANLYEVCMACYIGTRAGSFEQLYEGIDRLFNSHGAVEVMSTHKAKGGQAPRVWMLNPEDYEPGPKDAMMKVWEIVERLRLKFVARTRAMQVHVNVHGWADFIKKQSESEQIFED